MPTPEILSTIYQSTSGIQWDDSPSTLKLLFLNARLENNNKFCIIQDLIMDENRGLGMHALDLIGWSKQDEFGPHMPFRF